MENSLSKNILQTVAYYDVLNFPLTSFEIWKHLIAESACGLGGVVEALESGELKKRIEEFRGFYFLSGRRDLVAARIQGDKNSIAKMKIAGRVAWWLRRVPFVRMVAVTGTLAMRNCEKNSDIDFFVVLEKGRMFTGRLLTTAAVHLLGRRRHGAKIKNRICLNYFVATDNLEIRRKDLFAANEYTLVCPLFGADVFREFSEANAGWIKKFKPNWQVPDAGIEVPRSGIQGFLEGLINSLGGDRMEAWLKSWQVKRIERNPLTAKPGAYVEYDDRNLIFIPEPQGPQIEEEWQRRLTRKDSFL